MRTLFHHLFLCSLLCFTPFFLIAQPFAEPRAEDLAGLGKNISRTMHLLESSTAAKKNTVKILVYGQSISEQNWWLGVRQNLESRYPNANIIMENRAIGGFAAQLLIKPMYFDVLPFYPDLVLFHVYGSQFTYDTIVSEMRRLTTAEIGLQTNHGMPGPDSTTANWEDYMSYKVMPKAAARYKVEVMDIRTPWGHYISDNKIAAADLTIDGVHLNDRGNFLMERLISRRLNYNPDYEVDPYKLVTTYPVGNGEPANFKTGTLEIPFHGNKVDLISAPSTGTLDSAAIFIDGKRPSEFAGCYAVTRPNGTPHVGSIIKITTQNNLLIEDWTVTINSISCTLASCTYTFSVQGSKTGADGNGAVAYDQSGKSTSPVFVSKSKRIVIRPQDWYIRDVISKVNIQKGFQIKWSVVPLYKDYFVFPTTISDPTIEHLTVAAQGIDNNSHTLKIVALGNKNVPIQAIRIYKPYWKADSAIVTALTAPLMQHQVSLSPNPAKDQLHVRYPKKIADREQLSVYNAVGQRISIDYTQVADGNVINVAPLKEGIYFLKLEMDGNIINKKFHKW